MVIKSDWLNIFWHFDFYLRKQDRIIYHDEWIFLKQDTYSSKEDAPYIIDLILLYLLYMEVKIQIILEIQAEKQN